MIPDSSCLSAIRPTGVRRLDSSTNLGSWPLYTPPGETQFTRRLSLAHHVAGHRVRPMTSRLHKRQARVSTPEISRPPDQQGSAGSDDTQYSHVTDPQAPRSCIDPRQKTGAPPLPHVTPLLRPRKNTSRVCWSLPNDSRSVACG